MRHSSQPQNGPLQNLRSDLRATQQELAQAYVRFNQAAEPELVESCIYEINAINARFDYLYRTIKAQEVSAAASEETGGVEAWV